MIRKRLLSVGSVELRCVASAWNWVQQSGEFPGRGSCVSSDYSFSEDRAIHAQRPHSNLNVFSSPRGLVSGEHPVVLPVFATISRNKERGHSIQS